MIQPGELIVDNFAGGGGASSGMELGLNRHVDIAINHDPLAIEMHKMNHQNTLTIFNHWLPHLKGGEIKAFWLILCKTIAVGKVNTVIESDEFIQYGSHITRREFVKKHTQKLHQMGLIARLNNGDGHFRYNLNQKACTCLTNNTGQKQ